MLVENQEIYATWNSKNKKMYTSILDGNGSPKYEWTGVGQIFKIDFKDIGKSSKIKIEVQCDYCGRVIKKTVHSFYSNRADTNIDKDACKNCSGTKIRDKLGNLNDDFVEEKPQDNYTKEFLINEFYRYKEEFGKYPTLSDLKYNPDYPSAFGYNKYWGNFTSFLASLCIMDEAGWYIEDVNTLKEYYIKEASIGEINDKLLVKRTVFEIEDKVEKLLLPKRELFTLREYSPLLSDKEKVLNALLDLRNDLGKLPIIKEYERYSKLNNLPNKAKVEKIFNETYNTLCDSVFNESNKKIKTDESLISDLLALRDKLGRVPKAIDLVPNGLCEAKTYTRRFNLSFNELLESLGWETSTPKIVKRDREMLLNDFIKLYNKLNRIPEYGDIDNDSEMASSRTYTKYFKSIENILKELNLDVIKNDDSSKGFIGKNKNNEYCKSLTEINISNILIDSNIKFVPEVRYSDFDSKLLNKWRMDWYLPEYNVYIEYFGMYSENHLKRNTMIGKYSRKVKKKVDYCNSRNIKLLSIFKEDLNNNYENMISKFNNYGINLYLECG